MTLPEGWLTIQRLVWQLYHIYALAGEKQNYNPYSNITVQYFPAAELYDYLLLYHKIEFSDTDKKKLWKLSKKNEKVYKSLLVRKFILDKYFHENLTLHFYDEQGNKVKELSFIPSLIP